MLFALMMTMLLGGLWHGASWNFVLWGFVHGLLLIVHRFGKEIGPVKQFFQRSAGGVVLSWLITQFFVFFTWLIFRVEDTAVLVPSMKTFLGWGGHFDWMEMYEFLPDIKFLTFALAGCFILLHGVSGWMGEEKRGWPVNTRLFGAQSADSCCVWPFTFVRRKRLISFISDSETWRLPVSIDQVLYNGSMTEGVANLHGVTMKYQLKCLKTGDLIDDAYTLHYTDNALLRAVYSEPFALQENAEGVWKYLSWLPVSQANAYVAGTVTYRAEALGEAMGLSNLWVTYHGYWPEKGGLCPTGSFKDMEAVPTIQRMHDHDCQGLICASAGNTARAFTHFCGLDGTPLIVVVGKDHAKRIWARPENDAESVRLVVVEDGDYYDAKTVAKGIAAQLPGWQMEGSVHNVARRDGIGSLMLDAAFTIGKLPDHYFQGIGGGPGPHRHSRNGGAPD